MRFLKADTAATVRIGPAVSISDGYTATASLAISTADYAYISDAGGTETDISSNTWAAVASVTGWYDLTLTAGQLGVEGPLTVMIYDVSLCLPVWADFHVVNANVYDSLFAAAATDYLQVDATQLGGVTQSLTDLKDFADDGYDPTTNKVQGVVLTDTVSTLTDHTAQSGDSYPYAKLAKYIGPEGPGVYYDDSAANTNTTLGTDGTYDNAVSTLAAALTLVTSLGVKRIYVTNSSTLALTGQTMSDYTITAIGSRDTNILNLGTAASPSVLTNFVAEYMTVYGTHDLSDRIYLNHCIIDDAPAAEITKLHVSADYPKFIGDFSLDTSNDNFFDNWSSAKPANGYVVCTATGAAGSAMFRHGSGGIGFQSLSASHKISVETDGQVVFESGCNVNADVVLRGNHTKVDNTAGMANLTEDARIDVFQINAQADTAISDAALATAAALTTAQNDLDTITGADGVTLATSQPNYAPAKAGATGSLDGVVDFIESQRGSHTWQGNIWYVAPTTGNDTTGDGSRDAPYATVTKAHTSAADNNHDIIFLLADNTGGVTTHTEQVTISKNYVFIRGPGRDFQWNYNANGDVITVTGAGVELSGFVLSTHTLGSGDAINVSGDFFRGHNLWIEYSRQYGIYIDNASWCRIHDNEIFDCGKDVESSGVYIYQTGLGAAAHNRVYNNAIEDVTGSAVEIAGAAEDNVIYENNLHGSSTYGIIIGAGALTTGYHDNVYSDNTLGNVSDSGTNSYFQNNEQWAKDSIATETRLAQLDAGNIPADLTQIKNDLPTNPAKGVALSNLQFVMVLASDGKTKAPGLTVTGTIQKDNGAFAALTNSVVEISGGWYRIDLTAAEMNADTIALNFTAATADDRSMTIVTQKT